MQYKVKGIFLICLLAIGYLAHSQVPTAVPVLYNSKIYQFSQYIQSDSGFFSARRDTNFTPKQGGCVVFKTSDSTLYVSTGKFTGRKWKGIGSGGGTGVYNAGYGLALSIGTFRVDTSLISTVANALYLSNLKLNKSDTASMLTPYLRKADTTLMLSRYLRKADTITISNRINFKLNISDTTGMLNPYLRKADTGTLSNRIDLKRDYSDTALNAASTLTRGRGQYWIDSFKVVADGIYRPKVYGVAVSIDGNLTVLPEDDFVYLKDATLTRSLTLPPASTNLGRQIIASNLSAPKWTLPSGAVINADGTAITFVVAYSSLTLVSNGTNWIATTKTVSDIWERNINIISPINGSDSLTGLLNINYGGDAGGFISINTGSASPFSVNGNFRYIDFPSASINTGLILSSTATGAKFSIRNGTSGSLTISPSYINASNATVSTIAANSVLVLVYDGTNYKQF